MTRPLQIWLLGDGRTGHLNQSLGLAEAIGRRTEIDLHRLDIPARGSLRRRIRALQPARKSLPNPDLLLGAGHRTHLPMIWLCRKTKARTVVLMRPSLPAGLFNLCLVPRHDLADGRRPDNVVATSGALNRVVARPADQRRRRLVLVGGPSGQHGWDGPGLSAAVREILATPGDPTWEIADSRRTPDGFLEPLAGIVPPPKIHPHRRTGPDWLASRLAEAAEVWVTEDSVSMVCEALTAGARVGILPMPRTRKRSRVVRGLEMLAADGYVTTLDQWRETGRLHDPPALLAEADRCAVILLDRLFPDR